jgi:large subunit ribosomal protein L7/L12|uniref:Large ribosomal subunit protein bL12c n=2 Tax=Heterosigma akashiwo TaxID=2829 RepID=A0A224AFJ8_HETAK|nr:50S ribosomal protein L12 [Heterosigma akashiwo]BBA18151.1 50S ribosomal protein L1 [Heterosigma akashiwo]BBA18294.1 50S ribosomal protein L1 [Heterosigma akashiwo]BBA18433.1 50S ribosomal protein L1 [Heterosigma akashiwo]BBA18567.1 50S ribosomal protein L1 [Heterosigma akashiwo]|mmetsp:Transcript_33706/g.49345  ORF Transcript_33706/g.49345 Transcript_33706/m.49345 type:complete len:129 (+) Transcript_33706:1272-1658(+)
MSKVDNIIEELKTLTLLEASELVQKIEETFNVDTSIGGGMMMVAGAAGTDTSAAVEEKTEFDVVLENVPADKKIAILKVVRTITGLGLKEAKELVDNAPKTIQEGIAKEAAEDAKTLLENAGAGIALK